MALEQSQHYCNQCGKLTLHQRNNESSYSGCLIFAALFLLTLLACAVFPLLLIIVIPIAPIIALVCIVLGTLVSILTPSPPFRCSQCGQVAGGLTFEQKSAITIENRKFRAEQGKALGEDIRMLGGAIRVLGFKIRVLGFKIRVLGFKIRVLGFKIRCACSKFVREFNSLLLKIVGGEENMILYRFLQVLTIAILLVGVAITGVILFSGRH